MNNAMQNHLGNWSRVVGHPVTRYEYILSGDELTNAWVQAHADLNYALKKESARDRYLIYNKKGLEKQIEQVVMNSIAAAAKELPAVIAEDAINEIMAALGTLKIVNNEFVIGKMPTKTGSSNLDKFAALLAKELVKGTFKAIEDMTDYKK